MAKFNKWEKVGDKQVAVVGGAEKRPLKMTATRTSGVLGYNRYKTPFQMWCEICRVAKPEFVENAYTRFGKVVEDKMHDFATDYISPNLQRPVDKYGDAVTRTWDYYPESEVLGGMWDDRVLNRKGEVIGIVEYKTSSRPQDWLDGAPDDYRIQAMQYAYLEGVDDYWLVVTFPDLGGGRYPNPQGDYLAPEEYVVTEDNTSIFQYKVSDGFDGHTAEELFGTALTWWETYVEGNISPKYDEVRDKEYLDIMRTNRVELPSDLAGLSKKVAEMTDEIEEMYAKTTIKEAEKALKELTQVLKGELIAHLEEGKSIIETDEWVYKQSAPSVSIDKERLESDGLLDKYSVEKEGSFRLTRKREG